MRGFQSPRFKKFATQEEAEEFIAGEDHPASRKEKGEEKSRCGIAF